METNNNIAVKTPFDIIAEIPAIKFSVTDSAVKTARTYFKGKVFLPANENGGEMSAALLCAMAQAGKAAENVESGMERIAYLVGASVYSEEWKTLYPVVESDGKLKSRKTPFKSQTEFISYMLPTVARSTALNYVSAVTDVIFPAKEGKFKEIPEIADMSVGMASNLKSALKDGDTMKYLPELVKGLHDAKSGKDKDKALTRNEWKSAVKMAREKAGKTKSRTTTDNACQNAAESSVSPSNSAYYALSAIFGAKKGDVPATVKLSQESMNDFRALVNGIYKNGDGKTTEVLALVEALAAVLNGTTPESATEA